MFPGVNPKQLGHMMKKMGIHQEEIDSTEVIIRTSEGDILIKNPKVTKVNMMGQTTYQVVGEETKAITQVTGRCFKRIRTGSFRRFFRGYCKGNTSAEKAVNSRFKPSNHIIFKYTRPLPILLWIRLFSLGGVL